MTFVEFEVMRRLLSGFLALIAAANAAPALADADVPKVQARLLVASAQPAPARPMAVGIAIDPGPGWHIYWQNPGETGYAPRFTWHLPPGYAIGSIRHPAPQRLVSAGSAINAHAGPVTLLTRLIVPATARAGDRVTLTGDGDLLVCSDSMCVPQTVQLERSLAIGNGAPDPGDLITLTTATHRLPEDMPGPATYTANPHGLRVHAALPTPAQGEVLSAFSTSQNDGSPGPASISVTDPDTLEIDRGSLKSTGEVDLVVTYGRPGQQPSRAFHVHALPTTVGGSLWLAAGAILGALIGGLLLNLMPCVFPILSLKAMALIRAGGDPHEARNEALGYLAGAVAVMLALGGAVLLLRAGGATVGWAFQLQDPRVVAVLLVLVAGIATNLAGLFELPSLPVTMTTRSGFAGGVGTGALAAFIATPCTGPFMAGALGAALVLPAWLALLVFAALGLGLALPFVAVGFIERARRLLPRPGNWMVTLRRLLSLPMFATALGLAWLLGQQTGVPGMTIGLAGTTLIVLVLWWLGLRQRAGHGARLPLALAILAICMLPLALGAPKAGHAATLGTGRNGPLAYSPARLEALRQAHRPVLLYATADWCLTCKVNEATSLSTEAVRSAFAKSGAVMVEADWTRNDPQISRMLAENGRAGIPLYIWYPAQGKPRILPQVLSPSMLIDLASEAGPPHR